MRLEDISHSKYRIRPWRVLVWGAGGHGKEVASAVRALGHEAVVRGGLPEDGQLQYVDDMNKLGALCVDAFIVAIGNNQLRGKAYRDLCLIPCPSRPVTVVHPSAWVSPTACLADGVYVAAMAAVQDEAKIGTGSIVNTGAVVSHGCQIGRFSHIAPNATLCGDVSVGSAGFVGAGAVVREGIHLMDYTVIGCGAAVVLDTMFPNVPHVGVPAWPLECKGCAGTGGIVALSPATKDPMVTMCQQCNGKGVRCGTQEPPQGQAGGEGSGEGAERSTGVPSETRPAKKRQRRSRHNRRDTGNPS